MAPSLPDSAPAAESDAEISPERAALYKHLDLKKYRGDVLSSVRVALTTFGGAAAVWGSLAWLDGGGGVLVRSLIGFIWALLIVRGFMIFHDAGHGSFIQGFKGASTYNWVALHLFAGFVVTPTDWNVGHALHHANVGNMDQDTYDWGETIFHTATQYRAMPRWKQKVIKVARNPILFFTLAGALTWYAKFRLPVELRPNRKANYRLSDKMLNLAWLIARYTLAFHLNAFTVILVGDYVGMTGGVVLFHLQHVYNPGYAIKGGGWNRFDASMVGSSILTIPECLKWVTLGIEYHHIHHFRTRVPGYALRACHEEAPPEYWAATPVLGYKEMWEALWFEVYDDVNSRYTTFASAEKDTLQDGLTSQARGEKLKQG